MTRISQCIVVFGLYLFVLTPSHAQLYKWVDEEGVTQYSDRPPPESSDVEIVTPDTASPDAAAISKMKSQSSRADKLREERLKAAEEKRLAEEERAIREENCRRSRAKLASYSVPNALILQQDGSRVRVDEPTRQRELASAREMIEKYCN